MNNERPLGGGFVCCNKHIGNLKCCVVCRHMKVWAINSIILQRYLAFKLANKINNNKQK